MIGNPIWPVFAKIFMGDLEEMGTVGFVTLLHLNLIFIVDK